MPKPAPGPRPAPAADPVDDALSRDRGRLIGLRARARQAPERRAAFEAALAKSVAARQARAQRVPRPTLDAELPVAREAEAIIRLIREHPVVVLAGETGSGKTTQLPKLCLAAGRGVAGLIGCTQPRRIAARSVARRVAAELGVELGGPVGYQVRFTEAVGEDSHIKFMTDGILLAEIQSDRWLSAYDTIIVDEAHERSLNIDFLLGYLKTLVQKRRDLKVIITSATIDTERFARHFGDAPVVSVEGRSHPVEVRYRPLEGEGEDGGERTVNEAIVAAADEITREDPRGDILVFLPGEREIRDAHQALERRKYRHTEVLPLYARLSARDQDRVFSPGGRRRIVLATNVAETSLTVPGIRYVIDPGLARVKRYSPRGKLDRLHIEPVSRASADQRKGRCGRVAAGVCYRLYAEADYDSRPRYTDPEILRSSLSGVILRMLSLGLGRVEAFPFLEPPDGRAVADGWQQLTELGAVEPDDRRGERQLTAVGRQMARLPIDPKLARMLIAAEAEACLPEMVVIAAFLGIQDPRERPADQRQAADTAHAAFHDPRSEFIGILKLWEAYRQAHEDLTQSKLRDWCGRHFLGFLRMREWRELHRQLLLVCRELGWAVDGRSRVPVDEPAARGRRRGPVGAGQGAAPDERRVGYGALHRALVAGLPAQVGHKVDKHVYEGPRGRRFQLFPGSPMAKQPPPWVLSATLLDTSRVWGLTNARIEPDWVIEVLPHLLARRHFDPHWSRAQGRVLASEQISLFGLVLAPRRPVHYGPIAPVEARELMVRQGLVPGELNARLPFLERNLATLERAREEEAKLRRAGLVADEDWQAAWYLDRLPADCTSAVALERWHRGLDAGARQALEWSLADLLPGEGSEAERFPKFLPLGGKRLRLHYRFEPGTPDDGVTLALPLHLLNALDAARLQWLVPGLLQDKVAALIRALPKALRRNFVPAPDFARAFCEAWPQPSADGLCGELARFLARATGAAVAGSDFDEAMVEDHLRMNLRVLDEDGRVLAESRDLQALRDRFGARAEAAFAERAGRELAAEGLTGFPEEPIPASVPGAAGLAAWPALVDQGGSVALRVFAEADKARAEHPRGVRRLLRLGLADRVREARRQLPVGPKMDLLYAAVQEFSVGGASGEGLRADIVEAALKAVTEESVAEVRDPGAFRDRLQAAGRALFPAAVQRLELAERILATYGEVRPRLEPSLMGLGRASFDDLRTQLDGLVHPGFLGSTPPDRLAQLPRYLQGIGLRAQRIERDPARDQARMLELKPFIDAVADAQRRGVLAEPGWQQLRWQLEELRVSVFAQELGTAEAVSVKRLTRQLKPLARGG